MHVNTKKTKRVLGGDRVKCVDANFQIGLETDKFYTIKKDENKKLKGNNRKIELIELPGKWLRSRFIIN